jgi:gamma-glutamyltranspeptidase/glutathione hydrolase
VATEHPLAVSAGLETLRRGGSAVDAAIAAATAIGVVNPVSCGLGGGGFMLVYDARAGAAHALDYRETAPAAATAATFGRRRIDHLTTGALAVAVPGEPAGIVAAHARFGVLPLATVLEPAIRYAREGFPIATHLAEAIAARIALLRIDPSLATVFLRIDGTPRQEGEILRQPDLARSLERLAAEGDTPFYRGDIAAAVVATLEAMDGLIAAADLAAYRVRWRTPLAGRYRHRAVFTMPPPGSGGILLEALNVLSGYDLRALGGPTAPTYLHVLAETLKAVFADRTQFYGDPDFVDVPIAQLTSPAHARAIRARISPTRVGNGVAPAAAADAGTAHVSVVDDAGNAAAITTTINTAFGAGIVARGTGITLNNEMADFSLAPGAANVFGLVASAANVVAPRKRPLSSMSPTVVVRDGRAELVIGGSGGPMIITGVLQTMLAVVDFGLSPLAAAAAARIHHQGVPPVLLAEPGVPVPTIDALRRLGHTVRSAPSLGAVSFVVAAPAGLSGAGEPRKGGAAAGTSAPRPASATP